MPLVDQYDIERVLAAADIVQIVCERVKLKRTGALWKGLCPFHQEKTPSFVVTPARGSFHCFGCGIGGDAVAFIREFDGVDFQTALKKVADRSNINLDLQAKPGLPSGKFRRLAPPVPDTDEKDPAWKLDRQDAFMWRFRPLAPALREWFRTKGIVVNEARELARRGLLGVQRDTQLAFVYESGVKLRRDLESSHSCFWLEGRAETPWLAGDLDNDAVRRVCLCEGESDTMRLIPMLRPTDRVIAMPSASWRPTPEMCWRIGAMREVVTLFDGDKAGRLAEEAIWPLLLEHARGVRLSCVPMEDGKDVCTSSQKYLTKGLDNPKSVG